MEPSFSVLESCSGRSWLITGSTGFIGGALLEQLLRTTRPSKVVLPVRPKHGAPGRDRVEKLLLRPVFDAVRRQYGGTAALMDRLEVVELDILSEEGWGALPAVDFVVHAAASIAFDHHIHRAITENYSATRYVLEAAARMPGLKGFVHVSTCYVNGNLPKGTQVAERTYPLLMEGQPIDHAKLVRELQSLPPEQAELKAQALRQLWGFPNNYALTKRLAELAVLAHKAQLPVSVARLSIVAAASGRHPAPGYLGNAGGATPLVLAVALGMVTALEWRPEHVSDVVPADCATSSIILAAAAAGGPLRGLLEPILHCSSSATNPLTNRMMYDVIARRAREERPPVTVFKGYPMASMDDICCSTGAEYEARVRAKTRQLKVLCFGLRVMGRGKAAKTLRQRWKTCVDMMGKEIDFNLTFENSNLAGLYSSLPAEEQELFPCLWRQGVDDWEPYCQLYLDSVWERYVLPLGRPAGDKGGKGSKPQPAKQQGAPAAGAAAAALAGVAQRWAALWGKERPQEAAAKNAAAAAAAGRSLKRKGSPPRGQQPVSRSRRQVVPL